MATWDPRHGRKCCGLKGMQVSREQQEQCYDFLSVTFDRVVLCLFCGLLKSICMFMIQFTNHTRMLIIFCLHDCVFLPLGLILIGLIYQKGLTIAKTIKWLTAVTTTKRTGGLNLQIFEWIVERDSISWLFWNHHFVENPINVENVTYCFSKKCTCARATINFERYSLFDKFILDVLFFRLSSHSFTDLSDRSVF